MTQKFDTSDQAISREVRDTIRSNQTAVLDEIINMPDYEGRLPLYVWSLLFGSIEMFAELEGREKAADFLRSMATRVESGYAARH
ncbi:MAG: hypothetical protein ACON5C_09395 [Alphaproteobacteria bacterium]